MRDKNGTPLQVGDTIKGKSAFGKEKILWTIEYSETYGIHVATNPDEQYDVMEGWFFQYEKV